MSTRWSILLAGFLAAMTAQATLVVIVPAKGATVVCADRRYFDANGNQFDADGKLQLLAPNAAYFVTGLEAVTARGKVVYAPAEVFGRYLAERQAEGIPVGAAIRNDNGIRDYLRADFERFLKTTRFPSPKTSRVAIEAAFSLGVVRTENHVPHFSLYTISQNPRHADEAIGKTGHGMEQMFTRSDPMYVGDMEVVLSMAKREDTYSGLMKDPYIRKFLLAPFGMPLTDVDTAIPGARRLISATSEGLKLRPRLLPGVSSDSVCAVLDYASETLQFRQ